MAMDWQEARALINNGETDAGTLLNDADPSFARRFNRVDKALCALLADVQKHFPDAAYYTASGGFHLMLGPSHTDKERGLQELVALSGEARIGDGDF